MSGDPSGLFVLFFIVAICLAIGNFILRARYGITSSQRRYWNRPWGPPPGPWNQGQMPPPGQPWNTMSGMPPYGPPPYGAPQDAGPGWQSQPGPYAAPGCDPGPAPGGFDPGSAGGGFAGFGGSCDPGGGASPPDAGGGTAGSIPS